MTLLLRVIGDLFNVAIAETYQGGRLAMDLTERLERVADEFEITKVLSDWAYARDNGDWDVLADCYHDDATMNISWISGPASEFIEQSKGMLAAIKPNAFNKHNVGDARINVNGNRATSEVHIELISRMSNEDFEFDCITWARFLDLFEKRDDGVWRIFQRTMVYEKDRLDPVNPDQVPAGYFDNMNLDQFPPEARFLCYRLGLRGYAPEPNIVPVKSEAEKQLRADAKKWLEG
jgi:ketosteroid isomerase-like protein